MKLRDCKITVRIEIGDWKPGGYTPAGITTVTERVITTPDGFAGLAKAIEPIVQVAESIGKPAVFQ